MPGNCPSILNMIDMLGLRYVFSYSRLLELQLRHRKVANICDGGYIGIRKTLSLLSSFLQSPRQNAHATFITLFINAVKEAVKRGDPRDETPDMQLLTNYLPLPQTFSMNDADMVRIWDARDLALDVDKFFSRYVFGGYW